MKPTTTEQIEHPLLGLSVIIEDDPFTSWEVALTNYPDAGPAFRTMIGVGQTRQEAITQAVRVLEWATDALQGPPPGLVDKK